MNIRLGNLSVKEIENKLGIEFPDDIREFMKESRQHNASNIEKGKWHCFDMPFEMVCGDKETATKIFKSVESKSDQCKTSLRFSLTS